MKYEKIVQAKFIERENRFVARVELPESVTLTENKVETDGKAEGDPDSAAEVVKVHVKNTGRCRELLVPGSTVYLEDLEGRMGSRRMRYSLVAVEKKINVPEEKGPDARNGDVLLINMDSQAPNKVVHEALADGRIRLPGLSDGADLGRCGSADLGRSDGTDLGRSAGADLGRSDAADSNDGDVSKSEITLIKPEVKYGDSRFDFYVEADGAVAENSGDVADTCSAAAEIEEALADSDGNSKHLTNKQAEPVRAFIEVKGVTLEEDGHARFPDAPTERGVKHINELIRARSEGYLTYVIFVVQMKGMKDVSPNYDTHPEFGKALKRAAEEGVSILAYDCKVTPDSLTIDSQIKFCF